MSADNTADAQGVPTDVEISADSTADAQGVPTDVEISAENTADAQGVPTDVEMSAHNTVDAQGVSTDETADAQCLTTDAEIGKVNANLLSKSQNPPSDAAREEGVGMEHTANGGGTNEQNVDEDSEGTYT